MAKIKNDSEFLAYSGKLIDLYKENPLNVQEIELITALMVEYDPFILAELADETT